MLFAGAFAIGFVFQNEPILGVFFLRGREQMGKVRSYEGLIMRRVAAYLRNGLGVLVLMTACVSCQTGLRVGASGTSIGPWVPDNGDGTYKNPVICADYSDPDVVRAGDDFYLVSSSFNCVPGLPILHSKDLVNWTIIGHVFDRFPYGEFDTPQHGNGVWAPSIRYHKGEFYVYYGDPDYGIFMAKTRNPAGRWGPLVRVQESKGWIDPCPFWDDDGNAYLVHAWANSRAGINSILTVNRMSADGTKLLDDGKLVVDGRKGKYRTLEGPKMYKRNGFYYLMAPAGGVPKGYQLAFRSRDVFGPYEGRVVMEQGKTEINGPHQGGWVELKSGENWFIHFQDRGAYGRVVHLQPVKWVDDWPVMGDGKGEPVLTYKKPDVGRSYPVMVPQTSDEFDSRRPGLQWQWEGNYHELWMSLTQRPGWLRLFAVVIPDKGTNLWSAPNLILQKLPAPEFTVTTKIEFGKLAVGEKAGLIIMGASYSYLAVERTSAGDRVIKVTCPDAAKGGKESEEGSANCTGDSLLLRVKVSPGAICQFSYSTDGKDFVSVGESFTATAGRWMGAKVGLFSEAKDGAGQEGYADFDWFRFE
jgi:beta-xylosidase